MKRSRRTSVSVSVDVDIDDVLDELDDDDLRAICAERKIGPTISIEEDLLRQALEDRDWRKVEELAERCGVYWFRHGATGRPSIGAIRAPSQHQQ